MNGVLQQKLNGTQKLNGLLHLETNGLHHHLMNGLHLLEMIGLHHLEMNGQLHLQTNGMPHQQTNGLPHLEMNGLLQLLVNGMLQQKKNGLNPYVKNQLLFGMNLLQKVAVKQCLKQEEESQQYMKKSTLPTTRPHQYLSILIMNKLADMKVNNLHSQEILTISLNKVLEAIKNGSQLQYLGLHTMNQFQFPSTGIVNLLTNSPQ